MNYRFNDKNMLQICKKKYVNLIMNGKERRRRGGKRDRKDYKTETRKREEIRVNNFNYFLF